MTSSLPSNIHLSTHPLLRAKLSQLRSSTTTAKETKALVHDIALILGVEALGHALQSSPSHTDTTPLGYEYTTETITPERISVMPILRSGLGMVDAIQNLLPTPVPIHHLGLFRDKATLSAVEYYNNLPYREPSAPPSELTILLDPIIATGATACAAIDTLRDWGTQRIVMISVLGSMPGLIKAAEEWGESVEIWVGAVDEECDANGMIKPGLGDVGDRLFMAIGK